MTDLALTLPSEGGVSPPLAAPFALADFDYALPPELIAQTPATERVGSRLLHVGPGDVADRHFRDLPALVNAGDLLVFNDTRVIKSRLTGNKSTGGAIELLLERLQGPNEALFQIRASHAPRPGQDLLLPGNVVARVMERHDRFFLLRLADGASFADYLEQHGAVPLPPYIQRSPGPDDEARYQTVYSRHAGAVAAPTAGLHFDQRLLDQLRAAGIEFAWVTLHVGAGTFLPVQSDDIRAHRMHSEWYEIPAATVAAIAGARARGGRITAVGTTSLRALESAADETGLLRPGSAETALFITPGYRFKVVERLLTNFHLPRSTLLMLVSAFAGVARTRAAYAHAIAERYRFFSYGDAMLVEPGGTD
jgi:S-adenosylmethionine:tRNA ribosyltransferase-isomerase